VIKRISLLVAAALMAVMMLAATAMPAMAAPILPDGCEKVKGTIVCTVFDPPGNSLDSNRNNDKIPGGTVLEETTTQGNLTNFSPEPQGVGEECTGPAGQCKKLLGA